MPEGETGSRHASSRRQALPSIDLTYPTPFLRNITSWVVAALTTSVIVHISQKLIPPRARIHSRSSSFMTIVSTRIMYRTSSSRRFLSFPLLLPKLHLKHSLRLDLMTIYLIDPRSLSLDTDVISRFLRMLRSCAFFCLTPL